MNLPRQKLLMIVAAVVAGAAVAVGGVYQLVLAPAARLDEQARVLEQKIRDTNRDLAARAPQVAARLGDLYRHTFGTDETAVGEAMGARLMSLLAPAGLSTEQINASAAIAQRVHRKANAANDREVSRTVTVTRGRLSHAINLLYILAEEPYVHRIDSLRLTPSATERGKVDLQFRYSTLAMEPPKVSRAASAPATARATTQPIAIASLDAEDRHLYKIIEERDIFRRYIQRPPPDPVVQVQTPSGPPPPPPPPPPPQPPGDGWRVAGLSTLFGTDVVHVRNRASGEVRFHKLGETLLDGKIVMIDYRELPRHDDPRRYSSGRVILQMKDTYWAVEQGDRLTDKHRLSPAELPPELRVPATAPAIGVLPREDARP